MQNIIEILKDLGIEDPEDKTAELNKKVFENYKTAAEFTKKLQKVESERDTLQTRLDAAEETLKGFEGVDLPTIQGRGEGLHRQAVSAGLRRCPQGGAEGRQILLRGGEEVRHRGDPRSRSEAGERKDHGPGRPGCSDQGTGRHRLCG